MSIESEADAGRKTIPISVVGIDSGIIRPKVAGSYSFMFRTDDNIRTFIIKVKSNRVYHWAVHQKDGLLYMKEHTSSGTFITEEKYKHISERKVLCDS
jgi:hypothetical protein